MLRFAPWFAASALALTACSGAIATDDDSPTPQALVHTQCSAAAYEAASAAFGRAIAWASARLSEGACESEHGLLWGIADETAAAIAACDDFRALVRGAHSAAPLRTVLDSSLTMASLSGELRAGSTSTTPDWTGLDSQIAKGVTFWSRPEGAYGSQLVIDFVGGNHVTVKRLVDRDNEIVQESLDGTYAIDRTDGTDAGPRVVRVTFGGKTIEYVLAVQISDGKAPIFVLSSSSADAPTLYSLVYECDA